MRLIKERAKEEKYQSTKVPKFSQKSIKIIIDFKYLTCREGKLQKNGLRRLEAEEEGKVAAVLRKRKHKKN